MTETQQRRNQPAAARAPEGEKVELSLENAFLFELTPKAAITLEPLDASTVAKIQKPDSLTIPAPLKGRFKNVVAVDGNKAPCKLFWVVKAEGSDAAIPPVSAGDPEDRSLHAPAQEEFGIDAWLVLNGEAFSVEVAGKTPTIDLVENKLVGKGTVFAKITLPDYPRAEPTATPPVAFDNPCNFKVSPGPYLFGSNVEFTPDIASVFNAAQVELELRERLGDSDLQVVSTHTWHPNEKRKPWFWCIGFTDPKHTRLVPLAAEPTPECSFAWVIKLAHGSTSAGDQHVVSGHAGDFVKIRRPTVEEFSVTPHPDNLLFDVQGRIGNLCPDARIELQVSLGYLGWQGTPASGGARQDDHFSYRAYCQKASLHQGSFHATLVSKVGAAEVAHEHRNAPTGPAFPALQQPASPSPFREYGPPAPAEYVPPDLLMPPTSLARSPEKPAGGEQGTALAGPTPLEQAILDGEVFGMLTLSERELGDASVSAYLAFDEDRFPGFAGRTFVEGARAEWICSHEVAALSQSPFHLLESKLVQRVLYLHGKVDDAVHADLRSILSGELTLEPGKACREGVARALRRALIYLSYPTMDTGEAYVRPTIDAGTNLGWTLFLRENAKQLLVDAKGQPISDAKLIFRAMNGDQGRAGVNQMTSLAVKSEGFAELLKAVHATGKNLCVAFGDIDKAIELLDQRQTQVGEAPAVVAHFKDWSERAAALARQKGLLVDARWFATLVLVESHGLPAVKYEHHLLYQAYAKQGDNRNLLSYAKYASPTPPLELANFRACRLRSSSFGVTQQLGCGEDLIEDSDIIGMLSSSKEKQLAWTVNFLVNKLKCLKHELRDPVTTILEKANPESPSDHRLRCLALAYNGDSTGKYATKLYVGLHQIKQAWS